MMIDHACAQDFTRIYVGQPGPLLAFDCVGIFAQCTTCRVQNFLNRSCHAGSAAGQAAIVLALLQSKLNGLGIY